MMDVFDVSQIGPVGGVMLAIVGLMIAVTVGVWLAAHFAPSKIEANLKVRIRSWWVMVAIFILAISVHANLSIFFIALLSYLALKEYYSLVHMRIADRRAILLAYLAIPIQFLWVYMAWYGMFIVFIPVYMFFLLSFRLVVAGQTERFLTSAGKLHWGLMAFVFGVSHLALLLILPDKEGFDAGPRGLLLYVVLLTELNDVLQYIFGRTFGKRKLAPRISPNKTWEGFLGGLTGTAVLAVLLQFLTPLAWAEALMVGVLISLVGVGGDLVISAIKRDVGVKDSGTLIPGHGGVLDRVDSLCFTAPIFFHVIHYLHF